MKVIKWFIKLITALILSAFFAIFCAVVLTNAVATNVVFNAGYYETLIFQTEIASDIRERMIKQKTAEFTKQYEGDLEEQFVREVISAALSETFQLHWVRDHLQKFSHDIVEFGLYKNDGFFTSVELKEELENYRRNVGRIINEKNESLSTEQIIVYTDQIENASKFEAKITFTEILESHFDPVIMGHIMSVPEQRETVILAIYFLSGVFALLFYFLIGMSSGLRWAGFTMLATSGALIYARFEYLEAFLGDVLNKLQISKVFATYLLEKSTIFLLKVPIIFAVVGLILFIIGILTEPKKKTEKIKEDLKEEIIEIEEEEVIEKIKEETVEPKKTENTYDPFAESPPHKETSIVEYDILDETSGFEEPKQEE